MAQALDSNVLIVVAPTYIFHEALQNVSNGGDNDTTKKKCAPLVFSLLMCWCGKVRDFFALLKSDLLGL